MMDLKKLTVKSTLDKKMMEDMTEASKQIQKKIASREQLALLI